MALANLNEAWKASDKDAIQILSNYQSYLETIRQDYEPLWQDIVDYLNFNRFNFLQNKQRGQKANTLIYDGSPVTSWKLLVAGIQGNTIAQTQKWFSLTIPNVVRFPRWSPMRKYSGRLDDIPEVKVWLEDKEDQMYCALNRSNFYSEATMIIADVSSMGTGSLFVEEDIPRKRINFLCMNPGEVYIGENRFGEVDTIFRKFALQARQAAQEFGTDVMDVGLKNSVDNAPTTDYGFIHGVFPRNDIEMYFSDNGEYKPKAGVNNQPWVSMYIQGGNTVRSSNMTPNAGGVGTKVLKRSGFRFNPFITWRWLKNSEETYGRSPAMDAIVDIIRLNVMGRTMLLADQKAVEPPVLAHEKFRNRLRLNPNGINYYTSGHPEEQIKAIQQNIQLRAGVEAEDRIQKIIDKHFMTEFFVMLWRAAMEGSQLSVPQVLEMQGEKASIMMPMMERMIPDFLNPVIDRVDKIETDAGRMPDMPPILQDIAHEVKTEYNGTLAVAQKRWAKAQGVLQGVEMLKPLFEAFPETKDVIDPTGTAIELLKVSGWPAKGICTADEIARKRKDRAAAEAQMAQEKKQEKLMQYGPGLAKMAAKGGALENIQQNPEMAANLQNAAKGPMQ
jgi:hypothetical protein